MGSGNGLVPWGNKPLPDPILTQICHHMVSLGQNELNIFVNWQECPDIIFEFGLSIIDTLITETDIWSS